MEENAHIFGRLIKLTLIKNVCFSYLHFCFLLVMSGTVVIGFNMIRSNFSSSETCDRNPQNWQKMCINYWPAKLAKTVLISSDLSNLVWRAGLVICWITQFIPTKCKTYTEVASIIYKYYYGSQIVSETVAFRAINLNTFQSGSGRLSTLGLTQLHDIEKDIDMF